MGLATSWAHPPPLFNQEETMSQKFYANPATRFEHDNGAVSYAPGGPFDCIGQYAKIQDCPIQGTNKVLTCYATGYPETFFTVPACTRYRGKYVTGFFVLGDFGPVFQMHDKFRVLFSAS